MSSYPPSLPGGSGGTIQMEEGNATMPVSGPARLAFLLGVFFSLSSLSLSAQCDPGGGMGGIGPDVMVGSVTGVSNYGTAGGYYAYSVGTTSCNIGTEDLPWFDSTSQHPVIAQNLYRIENGRFQQIGMSWLKHGFGALQQNACGCGCQSAGTFDRLGPGCSDPYTPGLNGNQGLLGPRSEVYDPASGLFPYPPNLNPANQDLTWRRLRVHGSDLDQTVHGDAVYVVEGHYVTPDDAQSGNGNNNASYSLVNISASTSNHALSFAGGTERQQPGIQAWQDLDSTVVLEDVIDADGALIIVGNRVEDLGNGTWRYDYVIYNMNSTRAVSKFSVPVPVGLNLMDVGMSSPEYHSGEPFNNDPWAFTAGNGVASWTTANQFQDPNANAVRFSTAYSFWFSAFAPPVLSEGSLTHFVPGLADTLSVPVSAPAGDFTAPVEGLVCGVTGIVVDLTWGNPEPYDSISILRDGVTLDVISGNSTSYEDLSSVPGLHEYGVVASSAATGTSGPVFCDVDVPQPLLIGLPAGIPETVLPDGTTTIEVTIEAIPGFAVAAGSEELHLLVGTEVTVVPLTFDTGTSYSVTFPEIPCGSDFAWHLQAQTTSGEQVMLPQEGPASPFLAVSALGVTDILDDFEIASGWQVGEPNNATTGTWTRSNPNGTNAQPEDDHTPAPGVNCWFTGQGSVGGSNGQNDVDGGTTTLYSPVFDLSQGSDPLFSYWRWYSNDTGPSANADVLVIQISDNLVVWNDVEVVGPGGAGTSGGWIFSEVLVSDHVSLTSTIQMRFQASDLGSGSIVEAAVDDFLLHDLECAGIVDCNENGIDDSIDISSMTSTDCDFNGIPDECDIESGTHVDCNSNGFPDSCDVQGGTPDCNENGIPDSCDLAAGTPDCDSNGTPDECDPDCDSDGTPDSCAIAGGEIDCDGNGIPDSCDSPDFIRGDSNGDEVLDISDAIGNLGYVFGTETVGCLASLDVNADLMIDIADGIRILTILFSGRPAPPLPFPDCGPDPAGSVLTCCSPSCP